MPPERRHFNVCNYLLSLLSTVFSHCWFAMPQLVLQADWQEVWHSPQPPFFALSQRLRVSIVSICFIIKSSNEFLFTVVLYYFFSHKSRGDLQFAKFSHNIFIFFEKHIDKPDFIWYNVVRHGKYSVICCYGSAGRAHPW